MHDDPAVVTQVGMDTLATFLRRMRKRLDPVTLGLAEGTRRTPGLRREEVALRAHASVTWYTWLEQGRGGTPSADMLDRLARALALSGDEREHLFLLAQRRLPEVGGGERTVISMSKLGAVLDTFHDAAAYIKDYRWDVLAWNAGARAILTDYAALSPERRNILDIVFCTPEPRARVQDWEYEARAVIAAFRRDIARADAVEEVAALITDIARRSDDFRRLWEEGTVASLAEGRKVMAWDEIGQIALDYNAFEVEGAPGLTLVVYVPITAEDRATLRAAIDALPAR